MKTFIKVTEIWIPTKDRTRLEFGSGLYGELNEFRVASEKESFAYDEGLPGKAWAAGHPVVLTEFDYSYFKRTKSAKRAGLTCGIAMPVFSGEFIMAVVVFLCGDDQHHAGAIEVWSNSLEKNSELAVVDGYYGTLDDFERLSGKIKFTKGAGLPGQVWETGMPVLIEDLGLSTTFIRSADARKAGITTALGIPVSVVANQVYIMTFLSAKATPIAKRIQIWAPDQSGQRLVCQAGYSKQNDELAEIFETISVRKGEGILGRVWLTGVPAIRNNSGIAVTEGGLSSMLAIPVIDSGSLKAVVTFLF
ncbi:GAF domain-containing protein [Methylobacter sp.]|uniref:GAF domain-containing protein n=1 Tax=Methylobacter sp. TaxID=2051955 RepID=UPI0011FCF069|nr:GAF domain-containing protein [Methylobacter sp.]TAK59942.1 MAG: GAF domain-containing protein [Methylobacter sp.]